MQLLLDHLTAILVSSVLIVSMMAQQVKARQDGLERQSVYAAKTKALAFGEWLEDDVVKLGARFGGNRDRFTYTNTTDANGIVYTRTFTFHYNERANADGSHQRIGVRYELVATDSLLAAVDPDSGDSTYVQFYRMDRSEQSGRYQNGSWTGGEPEWTLSEGYRSPHGLSHFAIRPLDSDGRTDVAATDADYVRIQFSIVPTLFPLHRARIIPRTGLYWATTQEIRPF